MSLKIREIENLVRERRKESEERPASEYVRRERKVSRAVVTMFRFVAAIVCC